MYGINSKDHHLHDRMNSWSLFCWDQSDNIPFFFFLKDSTCLAIGILDIGHLIIIETLFCTLFINSSLLFTSPTLLQKKKRLLKKWETVSQSPLSSKNKANLCPLTPFSSSPLQYPHGHQVLINLSSCFLPFLDNSRKIKSMHGSLNFQSS